MKAFRARVHGEDIPVPGRRCPAREKPGAVGPPGSLVRPGSPVAQPAAEHDQPIRPPSTTSVWAVM